MISIISRMVSSFLGSSNSLSSAASTSPTQPGKMPSSDGSRVHSVTQESGITPGVAKKTPEAFGHNLTHNITKPPVQQVTANSAAQNKKIRESMYSRISLSFSKFISYFAFPKMSFPKSMAAQKEEAIAKVLDGTGSKEEIIALLKKATPMSTEKWASQRADGLIREAYGKRAISLFDKIPKDKIFNDSNSGLPSIKQDLEKAMSDLINHKNTMIEDIINFLREPSHSNQAKATLRQNILTDTWSNDMLHQALQSSSRPAAEKPNSKIPATAKPSENNHYEDWDFAGDPKDPGGHFYSPQELNKLFTDINERAKVEEIDVSRESLG